jgi:ADP-heptose:LPS heptosyltransferase
MPDPSNILIIRRRYLGDIVLLGPVFRSLRSHWPKAQITAMVDRAYSPILSLNPDVDHTIFVPSNLFGWCQTLRHLQKKRFTHVLDLDNRPRTALVTRLSGAGHRITLHHGPNVQCPTCYSHHEIAESDFFSNRHITDYYALSLRPLNIAPDSSAPELKPLATDLAFVRQLPELASLPVDSPRVFIHPGSRSPHRIWPADRFAEVITRLRAHKVTPLLVAGPGEQAVVNEIQANLPQAAIAISRPLSIPQLAALFASGQALLCHDSGPMHLAAAVGTKVVALFSSQNVATWKPLGAGHITLQAPMPCSPCLSPGFCKPSDSYFNHCVRHLSVDQVFAAVLQLLNAQQT